MGASGGVFGLLLAPLGVALHLAGDCLAPRSAEEAVYEGMLAGLAV